jgi:uncharacterized protein DUF4833
MKRVPVFLVVLLFTVGLRAQKIVPFYGPFPEPAPNKNMLFYLQRSIDRNTVIYELNYDAGGTLNKKHPVKAYWIDFEDGAKITPLTFAQSKFAYGLASELIDEEKGIFEITLVSYKRIRFYLKPAGKGHHQLHALIKGKQAILNHIFVNIIGGTYFNPVVSSIELWGKDLKTGAQVSEQIKPAKD